MTTVILPYSAINWSYSDLQTKIANWLHRTDLSSVIPDFIDLAETRLNGELDSRLMDKTVILPVTASTNTTPAPTDIINIRSMTLQDSPRVTLRYVSPDEMSILTRAGAAEQPSVFTVIGSNIVLGSTPSADSTIEMSYKAQLPALSENGTNWLLQRYPDAYLFASLIVGARYCVWSEERIASFEKSYQDAVKAINTIDWYSGSTMQVRAV